MMNLVVGITFSVIYDILHSPDGGSSGVRSVRLKNKNFSSCAFF